MIVILTLLSFGLQISMNCLSLCQLYSALCVTCRADSCNSGWDSLPSNPKKSVTDESPSERARALLKREYVNSTLLLT